AALRNSGDLRGAREQLVEAAQLATRSGLLRSAGYARLLLNRGRISMYESRMPAAQIDLRKSLELYRSILGPRRLEVAEVLSELSTTMLYADDVAQAEVTARDAIEIFGDTAPPMYPDRLAAESGLAEALYLQNKLQESSMLFTDILRK